MKKIYLAIMMLSAFSVGHADNDNTDNAMKALTQEGGHISNTDKDLFRSSVKSEKSSIAYETLDAFYQDAVEYQNERRYDEAIELYEKILSIDATYKDAADRRDWIIKHKTDTQQSSMRRSAQDYIRKGDSSVSKGLTLQAIAYWKQALQIDPTNAAAKKKIDDVNKAMARRQFEAGYIHYKHNEMEDALDSWQNAVAFDPTLKNRGLLLLMAKVELSLQQEQLTRLANQGYDQYQAGDLQSALKSYQEVLDVQPRHDEARRMSAKIKIQLGRQELKAATEDANAHRYASAIEHYQACLDYGWEPIKAQAGVETMKHKLELAKLPPPAPKSKTKPKAKPAPPPAETGPDQSPPPATAVDPKAAKEHYRAGLQAIRAKDYQRAVEELQTAQQLDATDERIYMALQRAKQEWQATSVQ